MQNIAISKPVSSLNSPSPVVVAQPAVRVLAGMLLAASLGTVLLLADWVIEAWVGPQALLGWVSLWAAVFVTLALTAPQLCRWNGAVARWLAQALHARRQAAIENANWTAAAQDFRARSELRAAWARHSD